MNPDNKPPRKRKPNLESPQDPKTRPDSRDQPAAAERTEEAEPVEQKQERQTPDVAATDRQPVTNADEQDRITNTGSGNRPVPEK